MVSISKTHLLYALSIVALLAFNIPALSHSDPFGIESGDIAAGFHTFVLENFLSPWSGLRFGQLAYLLVPLLVTCVSHMTKGNTWHQVAGLFGLAFLGPGFTTPFTLAKCGPLTKVFAPSGLHCLVWTLIHFVIGMIQEDNFASKNHGALIIVWCFVITPIQYFTYNLIPKKFMFLNEKCYLALTVFNALATAGLVFNNSLEDTDAWSDFAPTRYSEAVLGEFLVLRVVCALIVFSHSKAVAALTFFFPQVGLAYYLYEKSDLPI